MTAAIRGPGDHTSIPAPGLPADQVRVLYWERPVPGRIPERDDVLLYRPSAGADLQEVKVLSVEMSDRTDPNVWDVPPGTALPGTQLRRDPAPLVTFFHGGGFVASREARVPGQPGWVWPPEEATR